LKQWDSPAFQTNQTGIQIGTGTIFAFSDTFFENSTSHLRHHFANDAPGNAPGFKGRGRRGPTQRKASAKKKRRRFPGSEVTVFVGTG